MTLFFYDFSSLPEWVQNKVVKFLDAWKDLNFFAWTTDQKLNLSIKLTHSLTQIVSAESSWETNFNCVILRQNWVTFTKCQLTQDLSLLVSPFYKNIPIPPSTHRISQQQKTIWHLKRSFMSFLWYQILKKRSFKVIKLHVMYVFAKSESSQTQNLLILHKNYDQLWEC